MIEKEIALRKLLAKGLKLLRLMIAFGKVSDEKLDVIFGFRKINDFSNIEEKTD